MQELELDRVEFLIFDLDGTLVDSEVLCLEAYLDTVPELDWSIDHLLHHYRGYKFHLIVEAIEAHIGRTLGSDYEVTYRARVADLFEARLKPFDHALDCVAALRLPKCIASSGPLKKIRHSLGLSGLDVHFAPHLFSAFEVGSWKPDPGLFLHAATAMGFAPHACLVIEDSPVGIEAARAADMQYLLHSPEGHPAIPGYEGPSFSDYRTFPKL